ncbi:MAG TPA: RNA-binding protein [Acidobacteriota bacterium]|jgi:RNA recognition motif-containing protein
MNKLYVSNLNFNLNEGTLESFIRDFGIQVEKVDIIRDTASGRSRGFGFVRLNDAQDVDQAISLLNGKSLEGRSLKVEQARERTGAIGRPERKFEERS